MRSVLDLWLKHREGLQREPIQKSRSLPSPCQSSSISQSGLAWSQWFHGQRLCIAIHRAAPRVPLAPAAAGTFLQVPTEWCLLQKLPWPPSLRESGWLVFLFRAIWPRWAQLEVSASLRGRAGKALLAAGSGGELGCLPGAAESFTRELQPSRESGFVSDNSSQSFQAGLWCWSNINPVQVF